MGRVAGLTLIAAKASHWNVAGVTLGSSLAEVQKINGKPFLINEFGTDAGGFVANWKGGTLSRPLGGCRFGVRFGRDDDHSPSGDRISSDNAELVKWGPVVTQIELIFPGKWSPQPSSAAWSVRRHPAGGSAARPCRHATNCNQPS